MASTPIIDIHVHSTLKPYGNSFYLNNNRMLLSSPACIWFSDVRTRSDNKTEQALGLSRYRQSDFNSMTAGQVRIACVSLYPVEKQFFTLKQKLLKPFNENFAQFASLFGIKRIEDILRPDFNYFKDLCAEYQFLQCLDGYPDFPRKYKLIGDRSQTNLPYDLLVIPSFEGCHSFCEGSDPEHSGWDNMAANVITVKEWPSPPLFVTFAHHFYNGLCTHARSLFEMAGTLVDQSRGMRDKGLPNDDGLPTMTDRGRELIRLLLSNASEDGGRRILIDVKHMSKEARREYYKILDTQYEKNSVPVICSHGAIGLDNDYEINMDWEDLAVICNTGGIIGIEIDQRILGYNHNRFRKTLNNIFRSKDSTAFDESEYFFRQIIAISEFAYKNNHTEDPWKFAALGSDYDGIINPLNSYPDASSMSIMYQHLVVRMMIYLNQPSKVIPNKDGVDAAKIVYKVMYENAWNFIQQHYKK